jgi:hypothetical protein
LSILMRPHERISPCTTAIHRTKFRVDSAGGDLHMSPHDPRDCFPDVRDGLTHRERIVLQCLHALQQECGRRNIPTGMLHGSVVEHAYMNVEEIRGILVPLIGSSLQS